MKKKPKPIIITIGKIFITNIQKALESGSLSVLSSKPSSFSALIICVKKPSDLGILTKNVSFSL